MEKDGQAVPEKEGKFDGKDIRDGKSSRSSHYTRSMTALSTQSRRAERPW